MKTRVAWIALLVIASASLLGAVAPGAPQSLTASVNGNDVVLAWLPPSTGGVPASYIVEAALSPGGAPIAALPAPSTLLSVPSVPNGVYYVRARAVNADGTSGVSNEVIVSVPGGGPGACSAPPNAATSLTASVTGTAVALGWTAASGGCAATGYVVVAGSAPGLSDIAIINVPAGVTTLSAAAPAGTYYVRVVALNAFGGSAPSNEVIVTVGSAGTRTTIGFGALAAEPNRAAFSNITESGVTITTVSASWESLTTYGNPSPFIQFIRPAGPSTVGELAVTAGAAPFMFQSIDLYSSTTTIPYEIVGIRNGATLFVVSGTVPNTFGAFATVTNPQPTTLVDTLRVRLTNPATGGNNPVGVDNIVLVR